MGLFAEFQPLYAECGVATFPVDGEAKRPRVGNYTKMGLPASRQLAIRFGDSDRFGLMAGPRNRLTVLDIDTPNEGVWADQFARYGEPKFIVRTGSGNCQAWYRHNGEGRKVRPNPGVPVDILGGGYVVAPPSKAASGQYQIIRGSLDDLAELPAMQAANDGGVYIDPSETLRATIKGERKSAPVVTPLPNSATEGRRNDTLFRACLHKAHGLASMDALAEFARVVNASYSPPLGDGEVMRIVSNTWRMTEQGQNWVGGGKTAFSHFEIDALAIQHPHAFALLATLRQRHWGRDNFALAKAYAGAIGWTLPRFYEARGVLEQKGYIICRSRGGKGPNDPPVYSLGEGV